MKQRLQRLLFITLCMLFLLACQRLIERPQSPEPAAEPRPPLTAVMVKAPADMPAERLSVQTVQEAPLRRSLPVRSIAVRVWVNAPVCDGNGTPLADRSYVRTVYTACRLSETSG